MYVTRWGFGLFFDPRAFVLEPQLKAVGAGRGQVCRPHNFWWKYNKSILLQRP